MSIKLKRNILTEPNSPHYRAHKTLESFWNDYRKGGKYYGSKPTVQQYNKAAYRSLINADISKKDAASVMKKAFAQQSKSGLFRNSLVPRIPRKISSIK